MSGDGERKKRGANRCSYIAKATVDCLLLVSLLLLERLRSFVRSAFLVSAATAAVTWLRGGCCYGDDRHKESSLAADRR